MTEVTSKFAYDSLASIRKRLLDLSSRNALLNYKFPKGKSIQFIQITPNQIFEILSSRADIDLLAIPMPTDIELNSYYLLNKIDEKDKKNMIPPAEKWAKYLGINTQLEFSINLNKDEEISVTHNTLQTLLYTKDLDTRVKYIRQQSESAISETGSNILYIAIGFLEWKESQESDSKRLAPLFTIPVKIEKKDKSKQGGYDRYQIKILDDGLISNVTLQEKLKNDFGLELPLLDEDSKPENYFKQIEENIIKYKKEWCIRKQVSLILLNFTKQAMYQDLDPMMWPDTQPIEHHPVIQKLFDKQGVENAGHHFVSEYNLDQLEKIHQIFPIIYDADSSQHSALIDAVNGENLVIEGPPGSGKSQTITNLIAAAINSGKKVLFVAEKMAALNVVKDRLDKAGLGGFCLELHSHKANKLNILKSLTQQYNYFTSYTQPKNIDTIIQQVESYKNQLNNYVIEINKKWKKTNLTSHEILVKATYYRNLLNLRPDEVEISNFDSSEITPETIANYNDHAKLLQNAYQQIKSQCQDQKIESHFWYGVNKKNLLDYEKSQIIDYLKKWTDELKVIKNQWCEFFNIQQENLDSLTRSFITDTVSKLKTLPEVNEHVIYELIPNILTDIDGFSHISELYEEIHLNYATIAKVFDKNYILNSTFRHQIDIYHLFSEGNLSEDLSIAELSLAVEQLQKINNKLKNLKVDLDQIQVHLPTNLKGIFSCTQDNLREIVILVGLIKNLPAELWQERHSLFDQVEVDSFLNEFEPIYNKLNLHYEQIKSKFKLDNLPDKESLELNYKNLCIGGFFKYFTRRWWGARRFTFNLAKYEGIELRELQSNFPMLIDYSKNKELSDQLYEKNKVLAHHYCGVETSLTNLKTLRQWYKNIRNEYGVGFSERVKLGLTVLEMDYYLSRSIIEEFDRNFECKISELLVLVQNFNDKFKDKIIFLDNVYHILDQNSELYQVFNQLNVAQDKLNQFILDKNVTLKGIYALDDLLNLNEKRIAEFKQLAQEHSILVQDWNFDLNVSAFDQKLYEQAQNTLTIAEYLSQMPKVVQDQLCTSLTKQKYQEILAFVIHIEGHLNQESLLKSAFYKVADTDQFWEVSTDSIKKLIYKNDLAIHNENWLFTWSNYITIKNRVLGLGLDNITNKLECEELQIEKVVDTINLAIFNTIARDIINSNNLIQKFNGIELSSMVQNFKKYDVDLLKLQREKIAVNAAREKVEQGISSGKVGDLTEYSLVSYEANKKIRHIPIRSLMERSPKSIQTLKPCFMMSPLSVAQYLKPGLFNFDLVVMDEASQILPEDAIGALARGKSAIIVGDPKQLPPTSFFSTSINTDDIDNDEIVTVEEAESILESVISIFKTRRLRWHYRSRHESLIAFSNKQFYDSDLVLFPSPVQQSEEFGIRFKKVNGLFDSGRNIIEAQYIVNEVCDLLRNNIDESIGIVAMNSQQRNEIEAQLELKLSQDSYLQELYDRQNKTFEPIFIKNLENVQGDERDVIIISMTYGASQIGGKVYQRFGPINQHSGWRRLNVLFTRSKKRMHIISSMSSGDILVSSTSSKGVTALKDFLRYCETGFLHEERVTGKAPDSDFEIAVMNALAKYGYQCEPQLGVAGYFLDLAVRNPDHSGQFLLGIECDGATYHSAKSSRDRDRLRQQILEGLGWKIHRIWSTDWFKNSEEQIKIIVEKLDQLKAVSSRLQLTASEIIKQPLIQHKMINSVVNNDLSHIIEVGDLVRYYDSRYPDKLMNVTISTNMNSFSDGVTHQNSPLAKALLGLEVGDIAAYSLPSGDIKIEIYEIIKV